MDSIIKVVEQRLSEGNSKTTFTYLESGDFPQPGVSLAEIRKSSLGLISALPKAETVLLLLPQGTDFIKAFFGCLYARAIAVPAALPTKNRGLEKLQNIIRDAEISTALTNRKTLEKLEKWFGQDFLKQISWLFIEDFEPIEAAAGFELPKPQELAFLQYTSGSTDKPKAVMVTHENIMANSRIIKQCFQNDTESVSVCWLPSFHDMGLIDGIIQPIFSGFKSVLMSPLHFLQKPVRWFRAISEFQATYSGGPNFAFDFCVERITDEELSDIGLNSLRCLYNGSEPIRADTLRRFVERFEPVGMTENKIFTCYGLAEATLAVTTSTIDKFPTIVTVEEDKLTPGETELSAKKLSGELVSSGIIYGDTSLKIVDPATFEECPAGEIGEIWVAGKSVTAGYRNLSDQTAQTFVKYKNDRYLRTGDLGFLLTGELFVTGRIKDLIIIRGKNHYPQDIENTVTNCHSALQANGCAAFSVKIEAEEKLVIVQEIKRRYLPALDTKAILSSILAEISKKHELFPKDVVLIKPGSLPKTSSGKIRRQDCRRKWLNGEFSVLTDLAELNNF